MTASTRTPLPAPGRADRRTPLAEVWRDAILATYKQVLAPNPRTRPAADRYVSENGRTMLPRNAGMAATSAAYLALTPFAGNVYHDREDMLAFAFAAAERLVFDHAGTGITQLKPSHFFLYPLATLYELAGSHAGRQRRQSWRETMGRNLRAVRHLLDRTWDDLGRTLPWAGTGPNHFPGWMAVGYHQARILEDDAMMRRIEAGMARQLRVQAPGGYFPEHIGPVMVYHHVSLNGFAEFHRLKPSAATRRAVERGADFLVHALYPDLRCIETFDERNRLGYMPEYSAGLAWTPLGRALMRRMVERLRSHRQPEKFHWDYLGGAFRCFEHVLAADAVGEAPMLPNEWPQLTWKLEDRGLVRKEGPWFYAMSAWVHPPLTGNPYVLERTQLLSIHHACAGLIVGGGNDIRSPHA
ncbi:MAG: hypothetical protein H0W83_06405, partial [Planctomycetes bacterium]|nr:hypothetical protein [Planctomycetota bacterium]